MDIQHRITGEVYIVTDTVVDWVDIVDRPIYRHIIIESLQYSPIETYRIIPYNCRAVKLLVLEYLNYEFVFNLNTSSQFVIITFGWLKKTLYLSTIFNNASF